ncbi:MAG: hypothetical protein KAI24_14130, partial [Planctomycetes bacterium]|nr:hypothetical protein [Planctomycetota bacterium]
MPTTLRHLATPLLFVSAAVAQCELQQVPIGSVVGGVNGVASAAGETYLTGYFTQQGPFVWNAFARWSGTGWFPVGNGLQGAPSWATFPPIAFGAAVEAIGGASPAVVVGGQFVTAGGVLANGIARYDGNAWSAMGSGVNGVVRALAADGRGGMFAGGEFTTMDGAPANRVAHWDGSTWSALGAGIGGAGARVDAMVVTAAGDLIVTGSFQTAGNAAAPGIARWDGAAWS